MPEVQQAIRAVEVNQFLTPRLELLKHSLGSHRTPSVTLAIDETVMSTLRSSIARTGRFQEWHLKEESDERPLPAGSSSSSQSSSLLARP